MAAGRWIRCGRPWRGAASHGRYMSIRAMRSNTHAAIALCVALTFLAPTGCVTMAVVDAQHYGIETLRSIKARGGDGIELIAIYSEGSPKTRRISPEIDGCAEVDVMIHTDRFKLNHLEETVSVSKELARLTRKDVEPVTKLPKPGPCTLHLLVVSFYDHHRVVGYDSTYEVRSFARFKYARGGLPVPNLALLPAMFLDVALLVVAAPFLLVASFFFDW